MGNLNLFRCSKYEAGQKFCKLCIEEKLAITLYKEANDLLNSKTDSKPMQTQKILVIGLGRVSPDWNVTPPFLPMFS